MPEGLTKQEKEQRRKLLESGELLPAKLRFVLPSGFSGPIGTWIPDQNYMMVGYTLSLEMNYPAFPADFYIAVGKDPTVTALVAGFSLKTTLIEALVANPFYGYTVVENFPSGTGYKITQGEPISFLASFNGIYTSLVLKGNVVLKLLPLEL